MDLKFSHVDIVVEDLEKTVCYYEKVLGFKPAQKQQWNRNDFQVEFIVMFKGKERIFFANPISGNLKDLFEKKGEGTIYRYCYMSKNLRACYRELVFSGVQPEDQNGEPLAESDLDDPLGGIPCIWLPRAFGSLSMEILDERKMESFMDDLRATIV
jgi:methylmalonyl-CoA/ethylmalonyl-CoA epimerase